MEQGDNLIFEHSLMNRFLRFEQIQVSSTSGEKLMKIYVEKRKGLKMLSWYLLIKHV